MGQLTSKQINVLIQQARASGLSPEEVEGVVMALLQRASEPDGAHKLSMAIDMADPRQANTMKAFIGEMQALRAKQMKRGADDLMSMTDEEWSALFDEGDDGLTSAG